MTRVAARRPLPLVAGGLALLAAVGPARPAAAEDPAGPEEPPICTVAAPTGARTAAASAPAAAARASVDAAPPEYYAFPLVTTGRITGTARAGGRGRVLFPASSPFGVAVADDGSYVYDLVLATEGLPEPGSGRYVVWVSTPSVDRIRRVGTLPADGRLRARVAWNKFLVVVTLEPESRAPPAADGGGPGGNGTDGGAGADPGGTTDGGAPDGGEGDGSAGAVGRGAFQEGWSGPIVLRGMSRSGMMHTMAGHGPFEQENCAQYGYD